MTPLAELIASPAVLPIERAGDVVRVKRMDEAAYAAASFLDQRLLQGDAGADWIGWSDLRRAAERLEIEAHFIFHIGHVGSTLLSRLIGAHAGVFSLREPAVLRPLALGDPAGMQARADLGVWLRLLSRTWRPGQRAVIKTTSFVSELAEAMLALAPEARAIALSMSPANYLRVILGGPNSRREGEALSGLRLSRLRARLGATMPAASEGERIAMSWLCEILCLHQASERGGEGRLMWLDFDQLLADPAAALARTLDHLGAAPTPAEIDRLLASGLMARYSKGPEHAYDADLRRGVMAQAEREHGAQVRAGMAWLQEMAVRHAPARAAVMRAADWRDGRRPVS